MKTKTIIENLKRHAAWAKKQTADTANDKNSAKAVEITTGCLDMLDLIARPGLLDLDAWLDRNIYGRNPPRKVLNSIATQFYRSEGKKSLIGLIDLLTQVLLAAGWEKDLPIGVLPVKVSVADTPGIRQQAIYAL